MNKLLTILSLPVLGYAALVYSGWGEQKTWNQKVTLEVETPNGVVSNSTVLTFIKSNYPKRLNASKSSSFGLYGEAPSVEIKPDQHVFALNLYEVYGILHEYAFYYETQKHQTDLIIEKLLNDENQIEIEGFSKPQFFYFTESNNPKSVKNLNHLFFKLRFGSGFEFKSVKYQITDEPRTNGKAQKILPWLKSHRGAFIPNSPSKSAGKPNIESFNRSVISRHYNCAVDGFMMNNLTYGYYKKGLFCSF